MLKTQSLKCDTGFEFLLGWHIGESDFDIETSSKILEWKPVHSCNPLDNFEQHYKTFL